MMAPGRCRSPRLRPYGFEFVGMGHFWLVDFVDCIERCYIQTFPFLFPSFMPVALFALLPSVTAIACIVLHFTHYLVSKCFHDADYQIVVFDCRVEFASNLRIDYCKRSSNVLGCVIQPCYEIGALLFLIFGQSLHFPASSRRKISRWQPMGHRRAASPAGVRPDDIPTGKRLPRPKPDIRRRAVPGPRRSGAPPARRSA